MTDSVSKKKRSEIMSAVRSKDSGIELKFRKALRKLGYRFRQNAVDYFGKPDIVIKKIKTVVFIDSCFWHGCPKHCRMPATRIKYWVNKIERNKKRDRQVKRRYTKEGWKAVRFWEHDLKDAEKLQKKIKEKIGKKRLPDDDPSKIAP